MEYYYEIRIKIFLLFFPNDFTIFLEINEIKCSFS